MKQAHPRDFGWTTDPDRGSTTARLWRQGRQRQGEKRNKGSLG